MTFDDLLSTWQKSNAGSLPAEKRDVLVAHVCRQADRLGATIIRRDAIETIASIAAILFFSLAFFRFDALAAKTGSAIVVFGACFIIYQLHRTRTLRTPSRLDLSVHRFCETEIERLDRQIHLLRSVLWWYITPIIVGVNLVYFGINGFGFSAMAYCVLTLFFAWWVHSLNQKAVARSLVPLRDNLLDLLRDMDGKA